MNKRGFSFINILIIIGLILIGVIVYNKYYLESNNKEISTKKNEQDKSSTSTLSEALDDAKEIKEQSNINAEKTNEVIGGEISEKVNEKDIVLIPESENTSSKTDDNPKAGYYKNDQYLYEISYPDTWPIKIRSAENVSIGTAPPKKGLGAIVIEVAKEDGQDELEEAKKEASKYPGIISFKEEPISINGVIGEKITINNSINKRVDFYIVLEKYNNYYLIKYSHESVEFIGEVEKALKTFKFTK